MEIEVDRPICLELYANCKDLGRFMLRSSGSTIAAGLVTEVEMFTVVRHVFASLNHGAYVIGSVEFHAFTVSRISKQIVAGY